MHIKKMDLCVDFNNVTLEKLLGRGSFAVVFKATWQKPDCTMTIAAKHINYDVGGYDQVQRLVQALSAIKHDHIIQLYGISHEIDHKRLLVLSEYAENGSLYDYIHKSGQTHSCERLTGFMYQCAKGLAYLHGRQPQIMHGDVKTTNLVISNSKLLKICDFGDIKAAASNNWLKGTDEYRAPEIYKSPDFYDEKCDAYSFGIVLWEVMAQKIPFENWDTHKIRAEVSNNNVRPDINAVKKSEISEDIKILIKLCWHVDPKGRPSMKSMEGMLFMSLSIRLKGTAPGMYSIVDPTEIKLLKKLGQGSYGEVFKASWSPRSLSMTYAVKRISYVDEKCKQDVEKEALLLTSVSHDNIIKLYGISHDTSPLGNRILLLMEYAENGSLEAYIHSGRNFAYDDLLNLMRQCVKALAYLHGCEPKIMHRDVKTANMVLTSDYRKLKICDFGLVKSVATKNTEQIGSIPYRAPEIYNTNKYDEKCDVYSFGIVLWEVMSQRQPFENCEIANIMYQVLLDKKRPDINAVNGHQMSNHIKLIITKCWEEDPKARPSMKDLESILQFLC